MNLPRTGDLWRPKNSAGFILILDASSGTALYMTEDGTAVLAVDRALWSGADHDLMRMYRERHFLLVSRRSEG